VLYSYDGSPDGGMWGAVRRPERWVSGGSMASGQSSAQSIGNPSWVRWLRPSAPTVPSKEGPARPSVFTVAVWMSSMGSEAGPD